MIAWLQDLIPLFKAVHITALCIWCGGLLTLPLMLARHDPVVAQDEYRLIRRATHLTYTVCVTPAAAIAVIAGTWLIFLRETYVPWLYAKLLVVGLLVVAHAWIGHIMVDVAESPKRKAPPRPVLPTLAVLLPVLAILVLVLGKPDLSWIEFPEWLREPRGGQFPFEMPSR